MVGGIATGFHYLVLLTLVELGHLNPAPATVIGAAAGALVAYMGNRQYTFPDCSTSHRIVLPRFLLLAALGAGMNGCLVWAGSAMLGWHYFVSQLIATGLTLLAIYTLNYLWTFK